LQTQNDFPNPGTGRYQSGVSTKGRPNTTRFNIVFPAKSWAERADGYRGKFLWLIAVIWYA